MLQFYIPEVKSVEQVSRIVGIKSYPHGFRNSIEKTAETCKSPCRKMGRGEPGNEIFSHYNVISETGMRLVGRDNQLLPLLSHCPFFDC